MKCATSFGFMWWSASSRISSLMSLETFAAREACFAAPGSRWWLWSARWWPSLPVATTQELMPPSDVTHVNRIDQPHVCSFRPGRTPCFFRAVAASALPTLLEIPSAKVRPLQQTIWTYRSFWSTHAAHARGLTCYVSSTSLYLPSNTQQAPKVSKWREECFRSV